MFSKTSTNSSTRGFILVLSQLDHTKSSISVHSVLFCSYLHGTVLSHCRTYSLLRLSRPTDCQVPSQAGTHGQGAATTGPVCRLSRLGTWVRQDTRIISPRVITPSQSVLLISNQLLSWRVGLTIPGAPHTLHLACRQSQRDTESNFILWLLLTGFRRRKVRAGRAVADSFLWPFSQLHLTLT